MLSRQALMIETGLSHASKDNRFWNKPIKKGWPVASMRQSRLLIENHMNVGRALSTHWF